MRLGVAAAKIDSVSFVSFVVINLLAEILVCGGDEIARVPHSSSQLNTNAAASAERVFFFCVEPKNRGGRPRSIFGAFDSSKTQ